MHILDNYCTIFVQLQNYCTLKPKQIKIAPLEIRKVSAIILREGNMKEKEIKRINELWRKSKKEGLTEEEKKEQNRLRKKYLKDVRRNLKAQLDNIKIDKNTKVKIQIENHNHNHEHKHIHKINDIVIPKNDNKKEK